VAWNVSACPPDRFEALCDLAVVWEVPIGRISGMAFLAAYIVYIGMLLMPGSQVALVLAR